MSRAIGALVCAAARERKNVVAIVGAAHLPGITARLEGLSGGRLKPVTALSYATPDELISLHARGLEIKQALGSP